MRIFPHNRFPLNAGTLRTTGRPTYTIRPDDTKYYYPTQPTVPSKDVKESDIYTLIDHHNENMMYYYKNLKSSVRMGTEMLDLESRVEYIIKCAAWLFCHMITLHPFGNGNGRICRILASHVLSELQIFSCVKFYGFDNIHKDDYYYQAIIAFQNSQSADPGEVAALLIDGLWNEWTIQKKSTPSGYLY